MAALLNPAVTIQEVVHFRNVTLVVGRGALKQTITIKPGSIYTRSCVRSWRTLPPVLTWKSLICMRAWALQNPTTRATSKVQSPSSDDTKGGGGGGSGSSK